MEILNMSIPKSGQWIKGSFFNAKTYFDPYGSCQKLIKSSVYKTQDNIEQGYKPTTDGTGILYSWKNKPLAYYDIPTLNDMIFSKKLWQMVHDNPFIKAALDNHCFWGEDQHRDDSEIKLCNTAIRVNDFHPDENNLVSGDIDLMDTPVGLTIYSLAKTGAIGNSSRGFGDLIDIATGHVVDKMHPATGTTRVDEDTYMAVSWDCVGFPACPQCLSMYSVDNAPDLTQSVLDLEKGLREQITSAIMEGHEKEPDNPWFNFMFNSLNLQDKKEKVFPLASSINFKNRYPKTNDVKKLFK